MVNLINCNNIIKIMKNWKEYFDGIILERGLDYYESRAVRIYDYSAEHVYAQVAGTMIYDVSIYFKDSEITSMYCDCPYGSNCKHLAATLYYIEEHQELLKKEDYNELIISCSYEELIEFLSSELPKNPALANKLKLFKNQGVGEDFYINKLKNSFSSSSNILKFLNEDIQELIELKQYELIFKLCKMLIDHINSELKYDEFHMLEEIIYKLDGITTQLRDVDGAQKAISDFLEYAIRTSDDYFILDELTDSMSRNGDMNRLIDDIN